MTHTIRVMWKNTTSGWKNFNWGVINKDSVIHISASEGASDQGSLFGILRTRGDARISVENVRPHDGGVEFWLSIQLGFDRPPPLTIVLDITVVDPAEQGFIVG